LKVVLDTNVFVSSLLTPMGQGGRIVQAWRDDLFELCVTSAIVDELRRVLERPTLVARYRLKHEPVQTLLAELSARCAVEGIETDSPHSVRDVRDRHVMEAAHSCQADVLVTNAEDLLSLREVGNAACMNLTDFLRTLGMRP
jgi:putative PIN family toxin of toxin-antitoxin system